MGLSRLKGNLYQTFLFFKHKGYKSGGVLLEQLYTIEPNKQLSGKNILITGGSSGIGYAIAKRCLDSGAKVLITGRNEERLFKAKEELGENCSCLQWDVSEVKLISQKLDACESLLGGEIDCLVNNAGADERREFFEIDEEFFDKIMGVHVKGVYFLTQEVVKRMQSRKIQGNICMITSQSGLINDFRPYNLAKAAINNYVKGVAKYGMKNGKIRCNAVAPGVVSTNLYKDFAERRESGNSYADYLPDKRFKRAEEIAEMVLFCLSDVSKSMTGQILVCDGGKTIL